MLENNPNIFIKHASTNDLTKQVNLLNSLNKILKKRNEISLSRGLAFIEIIKVSLEKIQKDTNKRLKHFCKQKGIAFI